MWSMKILVLFSGFVMKICHGYSECHLYIGIPPACSVYLDGKAWSPYEL